MGKIHEKLDPKLEEFIRSQHVFFVGTAPSSGAGHVNVSPKGLDSLRILGPSSVAYVDYPGSGVETIAHLRQNGRIVLMLCAFDGPPKILRLYGRGRVVEPVAPEFRELLSCFDVRLQPRSIIVVDLERIADSCGYAVPRYEFKAERDQLARWAESRGPDGLAVYQAERNSESIDGLPGLPIAGEPA
ncbi:MAG TPA: pyridoxamine 5'-phosphate oxidase family protein [Polyangiaceae bacterium]